MTQAVGWNKKPATLEEKYEHACSTISWALSENADLRKEIVELKKQVKNNVNLADVSNLVLLAKPNYKAKDGTIKRGIEIEGKYYAPQNDC